MPDRLQELIQQRRLIEEHLAWLNREIAATLPHPTGGGVSDSRAQLTQTSSTVRPIHPPQTGAMAEATLAEKDADNILAEFQQNPQNLRQDVRRGCLIYFGVFMALLMLGVFLLYLNYASRNRTLSPPPLAPAVEGP